MRTELCLDLVHNSILQKFVDRICHKSQYEHALVGIVVGAEAVLEVIEEVRILVRQQAAQLEVLRWRDVEDVPVGRWQVRQPVLPRRLDDREGPGKVTAAIFLLLLVGRSGAGAGAGDGSGRKQAPFGGSGGASGGKRRGRRVDPRTLASRGDLVVAVEFAIGRASGGTKGRRGGKGGRAGPPREHHIRRGLTRRRRVSSKRQAVMPEWKRNPEKMQRRQ